MTYALPTIQTWFDLLQSTIDPVQCIKVAERLKLSAIGVVDQATTLGHVPLVRAARDSSVHVVFGATLVMEDGLPLRILARTDEGYRNLCLLVSFQAQGRALLPLDIIRAHHHGLYLLCGGRRGRVWQELVSNNQRLIPLLGRLQALAERPDYFVLEAQQYRDDIAADGEILRRMLEGAEQAGVRVVATHDVRVLHGEDARRHRLLRAIDQRRSFWSSDVDAPQWNKQEPSRYALPEPKTWYRQWDGLDHLVAGSAAVLRDCQVELLGRQRFPGASLPKEHVYDDLLQRALSGLRQRYPRLNRDLMERLLVEVNEVQAQGVAPFLIHAAELVERAAAQGIRMILQGSGTGSLLCYALGISPVDPVTTHGLVFERFAGSHRGLGDLPDLDFGISAGREHDVKAILQNMFGAQRVAHLAAVVTLKERGALREAATALGWTDDQLADLRHKVKAGQELDRHERMVVNAATAITGQPHHVMRHSSGLIVADAPLAELYGVSLCDDGSLLLANKDDVEALQVLKFDILSWYGSAIFDQAEAAIHAAVYPKPDLWHVGGTDPATADLLRRGNTRSIPYLQSPAMLSLMHGLRVRDEEGIALALGALRPGASTTRPRIMAALRGGTATLDGWDVLTPEHQQTITEVLELSHGAFLFDEDLLRVAHALGLPYADGERLRKAIKKGGDQAKQLGNRLRAAALERGWNDAEVDVVLGWLSYIQRYTFLRGHALALAHVAWRLARLAAHYPGHFHAAVLDHLGTEGGGMYPQLVYVTEARRQGLTLVGPSVNSDWLSRAQGSVIHCGLKVLRAALSMNTLERIHQEAQVLPFTGVTDLRSRVKLTDHEVEQLIGAGALDAVAPSRRQARWTAAQAKHDPRNQPRLLPADDALPHSAIRIENTLERAVEEYRTLGWTVSTDHPLDLYVDMLAHEQVVPAERLSDYIDQRVTLAGVIVATRRIRTEDQRVMLFASLCDWHGVAEVTLFDKAAHQYGGLIQQGGVVVVTGVVRYDEERGVGIDIHDVVGLKPVRAENAEWLHIHPKPTGRKHGGDS